MQNIRTPHLARALASRAAIAIVDVLPEDEHARAHIPQSINVPLDADRFAARVAQRLPQKETPVVVYCGGRECDASARAAKRLERAGFGVVYDYEGGLDAWMGAGHPVAASEVA